MAAKGTKRVGNYPVARYTYKPGDSHHPQEVIACERCGVQAAVRKGSTFCSKRCAQSGKNNTVWKGDGAGYVSLHARVYRARGSASEHTCPCGEQAREWANQSGHYEDIDDYVAMCKRCHVAFDKGGQ